MMPRVGGEYVYVSRAFGPVAGFLSGWVALIVGFAAPTAGGAFGFASYVHAVVPALPHAGRGDRADRRVLTAAHMIDVRFGARVQAGLAGLVVRGDRGVRRGGARDRAADAANVAGRRPPAAAGAGHARMAAGAFARRAGPGVVRVLGLERRRVYRRRGPRSGAGAAARAGAGHRPRHGAVPGAERRLPVRPCRPRAGGADQRRAHRGRARCSARAAPTSSRRWSR